MPECPNCMDSRASLLQFISTLFHTSAMTLENYLASSHLSFLVSKMGILGSSLVALWLGFGTFIAVA